MSAPDQTNALTRRSDAKWEALKNKATLYSEAEWAQIRDILRRVGRDADTIKIGQDKLRYYLWRMALPVPRIDYLREMRELLGDIEGVLRWFERPQQPPLNVPLGAAQEEAEAIVAALLPVAARLRNITTAPRPSNATRRERNAYLRVLMKVWGDVADPTKATRKLMEEFLHVCAGPVFGTTRKAITHFIDRHPDELQQIKQSRR